MDNNNTNSLTRLLTNGSIRDEVRSMLQAEINRMLQTELAAFLGYEKGDALGRGTDNSRNGDYRRKIKTTFGELDVTAPRDRNGEFVQHTVPRYKRSADDIVEVITELFCHGNTTRDIVDIIQKLYGDYYSPATISNITKALDDQVTAFHSKPFTENYPFIFMDATYLNLRRDSVGKEALHVVLGITVDGRKEVLDACLFPTESAANYEAMLINLKERGLTGVLLAVSDGLTGMEDMVRRVFPKAEHQSCWVHLARNAMRQVRQKDRPGIMTALKAVYNQSSEDEAKCALDTFLTQTKHAYPKLVHLFEGKTNLFSFYHYPAAIRKTIYTTNLIESNNKFLKRKTNPKEQFPNEAALDRFVSTRYQAYNKKMSDFVHQGFRQAEYGLTKLIEEYYGIDL